MSTVNVQTQSSRLTGERSVREIVNVVLALGAGTTNVIVRDSFNATPQGISAQVLSDTTGAAVAGTPVVVVNVATSLPVATFPVVVSGAGASAATVRVSVQIVSRE